MKHESDAHLPFCGACVRACDGCYPISVLAQVFPERRAQSRSSQYMNQLHKDACDLAEFLVPGQIFMPRFTLNEVIRRLIQSENNMIELVRPSQLNGEGDVTVEPYPAIPGIMVLILQKYLGDNFGWVDPDERFEAAKSAADQLFFSNTELERLFSKYDPNHPSATSFLSYGVMKAKELAKKMLSSQLGVTFPRGQTSFDARFRVLGATSLDQVELFISDPQFGDDGIAFSERARHLTELLEVAHEKQVEFGRLVIGVGSDIPKFMTSADALNLLIVAQRPELYRTGKSNSDPSERVILGVHKKNLAKASQVTTNGTTFLDNYLDPMVKETLFRSQRARISYHCLSETLTLVDEAIRDLNPCPQSIKRLNWRTQILYTLDRDRFSSWEKR